MKETQGLPKCALSLGHFRLTFPVTQEHLGESHKMMGKFSLPRQMLRITAALPSSDHSKITPLKQTLMAIKSFRRPEMGLFISLTKRLLMVALWLLQFIKRQG
jgi:hypothetical protein